MWFPIINFYDDRILQVWRLLMIQTNPSLSSHRPIIVRQPSKTVQERRTDTDRQTCKRGKRTAKNEECLPVDQGDYINNYERKCDGHDEWMTKEKRARRRRTQDARRKTEEGSTTTGTETYRMSIFVISTCMCYFDITSFPVCVHFYFSCLFPDWQMDGWIWIGTLSFVSVSVCVCRVCVECHMGKGEDQ